MSTTVKPCEQKLVRLTQEEIIANTKLSIQALEELKNDHNTILETLSETLKYLNAGAEVSLVQEKHTLLHSAVDTIQLAAGEAQVMIALAGHLNTVESEKQTLHAKVRRLHQENQWLRDELAITEKQLRASQQSMVQLQEDMRHLEFTLQLKHYDQESDQDTLKEEETGDPVRDDVLTNSEQVDETSHGHTRVVLPTAQQTALYKLAIQKAEQGRYETAALLSKLVMEDVEKTLGHDHPVIATMLNILALGHRKQNNYKEASRLLHEAVMIREKCLDKGQTSDCLQVAFMLNNLSVLYGKTGNYAEAELMSKRALELKEKVLGRNHPDVAKQMNNLALVYQNQGKCEEVEFYFCRALDIYQKYGGPYDPTIPKTQNHLARFYLKQGKYKEAEVLFKQILTQAHEREFGTADDENKPIWMHAEDMEYSKGSMSKDFYGDYRGCSIFNTVNSPTIKHALCGLGALYRQQGKAGAAAILEEFAMQTHKQGAAVVPPRGVAQKRIVRNDDGHEGCVEGHRIEIYNFSAPVADHGKLAKQLTLMP
ncbi:kinesin light chain 1-like [Brachyhypopomus gauderio]|uniref:kinesin light chain 1-like n=1 Tax=Brachyhypopomus gauderio TaxID=698409 RepID=UPI004041AD43